MAAVTVGAINVEMTANTANFVSGTNKAAAGLKQFGAQINRTMGKVGDLFAPLGAVGQKMAAVFETIGPAIQGGFRDIARSGALVGGLTAVTGAAGALGATMFGLAEHASAVGAKIYEASEKTGIGAAQMSGLMALTKETGGDFDSLATSLARAGANLQNAITVPGGKAGKVLAEIMGGAKNLSAEGLKPMGDRLQDVLHHIFAVNDVGERNAALSSLLGKGWMQNVETLKLLAEQGYGPAEAAARRFGIFFDDNSARQAKNFQIAISEMRGEISGLGLAIGEKAIPAFTRFITAMQGMEPNLKALGLRVLAIEAAFTGIGIPAAIKMWKEADKAGDEATQKMTDFLDRISKLTAGEKAAADGTKPLTAGLKAQRDTLASLINREQDEFAMLGAHGNKAAELGVEYQGMVAKIRVAGGSLQESLKAQTLAFEVFVQKMRNLSGKVPLIFSEHEPQKAGIEALPLETQRSGIPLPEMIEATTQKVSMLTVRFKEFQQALVEQGQGFGFKVFESFFGAIDQAENKLAQMVVKGRANFREILPQLESSLVKAGLQSGVGKIAGVFGVRGVGSKPDGTASNPLHVIMAGAGGVAGAAGAIPGIPQVMHSMTNSLGGIFSKILGGFMAEGGDVSPGRAYMVGEKHPEFFVPRVSGSIAKSFPGGGNTTVVNMHVHGVSDADSFRRSSSQIMGDLHRSASMAHARNS